MSNNNCVDNVEEKKPPMYKRNWCAARSENNFISKKIPVNKFRICLPCPGYLNKTCLSNEEPHEWRCQKCGFYIETAANSEYFYCLCGTALTNSFSFKCSNANHGNEFTKFTESDLKLYLEKCLVLVKENK